MLPSRCWGRGLARASGGLQRRLLRSRSERHRAAGEQLLEELGELPENFRKLAADIEALPPLKQQVFCNREIRMDQVKVIGFDYDYTLASYKSTLQTLVYEQARQHLIERLSYPRELASRSYDPSFAIRGLVFDRQHGTLLKLSYAQSIAPDAAYVGRRRMSAGELRARYGEALQVDPSYIAEHMRPLNDLFALSEACLLADVVQLAVDSGTRFDAAVVGDDVSKAIGWVHMSGAMHQAVAAAPDEYLHPSPQLGSLLGAARNQGKRLFLLTNSGYDFVNHGMRFLVGDDWRHLFDVVIVAAEKPAFYTRASPFRAISRAGECAPHVSRPPAALPTPMPTHAHMPPPMHTPTPIPGLTPTPSPTPPPPPPPTCAPAHLHTHAHAHTRTHARAHAQRRAGTS